MLPNASCNLQCKYCINTNNIRGLDTEIDFDKLFARMDSITFRSMAIWGGEPLFNNNFEKVAIELRKHFPKKEFFITSNGTLLDEKFVNLFNDLDISYSISHDGIAQNLRCGDFLQNEKYVELIKRLKYFGGFNVTISKHNLHLVDDYYYFIENFKNISGNWQITFSLFELFEEEILEHMPSVEEYKELYKNYREIFLLAQNGAPHLENYKARMRHRVITPDIWRCGCERRLTIDTEGNIFQCQTAADRRDNRIIKPHLPFMCINCKHRDFCRGICPLIDERFRKKLCLCHYLYYDVLEELSKKV